MHPRFFRFYYVSANNKTIYVFMLDLLEDVG